MKKILFAIMMLVMATTAITAQEMSTSINGGNAMLLQPAGSYLYYGDQVMNKKQCAEFLSTRHQPAYETFQSGLKCTTTGWALMGAGLGLDLAGSLMLAFVPEEGNDALFYSGSACIIYNRQNELYIFLKRKVHLFSIFYVKTVRKDDSVVYVSEYTHERRRSPCKLPFWN